MTVKDMDVNNNFIAMDSASLDYVELGFRVFPCESDGKTPLSAAAPRGCKDSTLYTDQARDWWEQYPTANIGIHAGNDVIIIDLDTKNGKDGVADAEKICGKPISEMIEGCPCVRTPTGGLHLYYRCPSNVKFKATSGLGETGGIDIRTGNTYVVAPPSRLADGGVYTWVTNPVRVRDLPPLPGTWEAFIPRADLHATTPATLPTFTPTCDIMDRVYKWLDNAEHAITGQGGSRLTYKALCGVYHGFALNETQLREAFQYFSATRCNPPWDNPNQFDHKIAEVLASNPPPRGSGYLLEESYLPTIGETYDDCIEGILKDEPEEKEKIPHHLRPCISGVTPLPESLLNVPGFISEFVNYALKAMPRPHRESALSGALACLSHAIARKVCGPNSRPVLYLLCLAPSGAGKDYPREMTQYIMEQAGTERYVVEGIASGEAVEDFIIMIQKMLLMGDELQDAISKMSNENSNMQALQSTLLRLYTSANSVYTKRIRAGMTDTPQKIREPALTLYITSTPTHLFKALTPEMTTNGLLSRCTLIIGSSPCPVNPKMMDAKELPETLIEQVKYWKELDVGLEDYSTSPPLLAIPATEEANKMMVDFGIYCDAKREEYDDAGNDRMATLWTRPLEQAKRLSPVYACSRDYRNPIIDADAARWAIGFVKWSFQNMLIMCRKHLVDSKHDAECKKVMEAIQKHGGTTSRGNVVRKVRFDPRQMDSIERTLKECGEIEVFKKREGSRGPEVTFYKICSDNDLSF